MEGVDKAEAFTCPTCCMKRKVVPPVRRAMALRGISLILISFNQYTVRSWARRAIYQKDPRPTLLLGLVLDTNLPFALSWGMTKLQLEGEFRWSPAAVRLHFIATSGHF